MFGVYEWEVRHAKIATAIIFAECTDCESNHSILWVSMPDRVLIPCDWCGERNARIAKLQRRTAFLRLIVRYCQLQYFDSLTEPSFRDDDIRFEHLNNPYGNLWWIKQRLGIPGCHVFQQTAMRKTSVHLCFVWIYLEVCRQPWLWNGSLSTPPRQSGHAGGGCLHPWWLWHVPFVPGRAGVVGRRSNCDFTVVKSTGGWL